MVSINSVLIQYVLKFGTKNAGLRWPTIQLDDRSFFQIFQWTDIAIGKSMGNKLVVDREINLYYTSVNTHS